ncbi:hypothetical protein JTB14_024683 [Gonioctena quinquepunctata]|nr:hypothetical protein JTB14_024683 [Gonioctena quinquepunctata]
MRLDKKKEQEGNQIKGKFKPSSKSSNRKSKGKQKLKRTVIVDQDSSEDDEEVNDEECIFCGESYSNVKQFITIIIVKFIIRLLWFILIVIAIALSVYYILEIYYKYEENPFLVNLATRQSPIFTIPFPAVTICPVVKTEKESFNFTRAVNKIWNNETLTEEE